MHVLDLDFYGHQSSLRQRHKRRLEASGDAGGADPSQLMEISKERNPPDMKKRRNAKKLMLLLALAAWRSGHRIRLRNEKTRV
jgi:hypothetical protein